MKRAPKTKIGWEEWVGYPELGLPCIKAKIDTGARTSALHAFDAEIFDNDGAAYLRFKIHPLARNRKLTRICEAPLVGERFVTSSNGQKEKRYIIKTRLVIGEQSFETEITLTKRYGMSFRMLMGRNSLKQGRLIVDPARACLLGKIPNAAEYYK